MAGLPIGITPAVPGPAALTTTPARVGHGAQGEADLFSNVVNDLLSKANEAHLQSDAALANLVSGKTDNIHDVVLSAVKADLSFQLVLELRNRLTEAYQEIMRMQV